MQATENKKCENAILRRISVPNFLVQKDGPSCYSEEYVWSNSTRHTPMQTDETTTIVLDIEQENEGLFHTADQTLVPDISDVASNNKKRIRSPSPPLLLEQGEIDVEEPLAKRTKLFKTEHVENDMKQEQQQDDDNTNLPLPTSINIQDVMMMTPIQPFFHLFCTECQTFWNLAGLVEPVCPRCCQESPKKRQLAYLTKDLFADFAHCSKNNHAVRIIHLKRNANNLHRNCPVVGCGSPLLYTCNECQQRKTYQALTKPKYHWCYKKLVENK